MPNEIKDKFTTTTALTINLTTLASSTTGVGSHSDMIDNTTNKYQDLLVFVRVTFTGTPTANRGAFVYLVRDDRDATTPHRDDNAAATASTVGSFTILNSRLVGVLQIGASPSSGQSLRGSFLINRPGPGWGIAIYHDGVAALNSTGGDNWVRWVGLNPEVQ